MISIIVPVTRRRLVSNLLQGLTKQSIGKDRFEVVLVYDQDMTAEIPQTPFTLLTVECSNRHPCAKRNLGVARSTGDLLAFFDDDVVPNPEWLANAEKLIMSEEAHVVNGPDFRISESRRVQIAEILKNHPFSEGTTRRVTTGNRLVGSLSISLCNAAFSRTVWEKIGGFNEEIDFTLDDTEFFYLCEIRGYRIMKSPGLAVEHERPRLIYPYLRHRFIRRMSVGTNTVLLPQLFLRTNAVRIVLASYITIPFILFSLLKAPLITVCALALLWGLPALFFSFRLALKDPYLMLLMPPAFLAVQAVSYVAFSLGLLRGLVHFRELRRLRASQKDRWATTKLSEVQKGASD